MKSLINKIRNFIKAEAVLCISGAAAILTMFIIPPSKEYLSYLDFRVLALLLCLMAVVAGFNKIGLFLSLSERLLTKVKNTRTLSFVLILLCFFSSMWITNDVALITFVPFAIMILSITGLKRYMIPVIVLQTVAANLGSMLTPVGNPQNLYLYSKYNVSIDDFLQITLPYTALSLVFLCVVILLTIKKETLSFELQGKQKTDKRTPLLLTMYTLLFLLCLLSVLRILDYRIALVIVVVCTLIFDRSVLWKIDYSLLLTFVFFFIFVGNLGNISVFKEFLSGLLTGRELTVSIAASQVISNVPAAVLLSVFTDNHKALILGTNLGGLGTLIASLASLISYKFYCKTEKAKPGRYLGIFTIVNILFLAGLWLFYYII